MAHQQFNATIDTVARSYGLSADDMEQYSMLLAIYGNKSYLFGNNV